MPWHLVSSAGDLRGSVLCYTIIRTSLNRSTDAVDGGDNRQSADYRFVARFPSSGEGPSAARRQAINSRYLDCLLKRFLPSRYDNDVLRLRQPAERRRFAFAYRRRKRRGRERENYAILWETTFFTAISRRDDDLVVAHMSTLCSLTDLLLTVTKIAAVSLTSRSVLRFRWHSFVVDYRVICNLGVCRSLLLDGREATVSVDYRPHQVSFTWSQHPRHRCLWMHRDDAGMNVLTKKTMNQHMVDGPCPLTSVMHSLRRCSCHASRCLTKPFFLRMPPVSSPKSSDSVAAGNLTDGFHMRKDNRACFSSDAPCL